MSRLAVLLVGAVLFAGKSAAAQSPNVQQMSAEERAAYFARVRAASEEDRRQMMARLGLKEPDSLPPPAADPNRPGDLTQRPGSNNWYDAVGNTYVRSAWGNWSNYDESRASAHTSAGPSLRFGQGQVLRSGRQDPSLAPYELPDPLVMNDGTRVTTAAAWWSRRRPELLELFEREIYGRTPRIAPPVRFEVVAVDSGELAGKAIVKRVVGRVDNSAYAAAAPTVDVTLYLPPRASRVPVVVQVGTFFGPPGRVPDAVSQVLALGWAYATVNTGNIQADNGAGLGAGIIGLVNRGRSREPDDWGVLAAWSWGMSRALDYLETDPAVDTKRAAIEGHSRWGKTALLAGALDRRWAIVWPSCSGAMGASLEKRSWGETIDNVAGAGEYHWMAGNFLKYAGHWAQMPVDAHELIALVAPRPIFVTGGTRDQWSDPHGEFLAAVGADPVYRLLGARGLGTSTMPAPDVALVEGDLAFRNHEGGHTNDPDWPEFLRFAARYFSRKRAPAATPPA